MCVSALRIYTATFGKNLLKAYTSWLAQPVGDRADLRGREAVDLSLSDKEIFEGLQGEDEWIESGMHEVFEYLYRGTSLVFLDLHGVEFLLAGMVGESKFTHAAPRRIPDTWQPVMSDYATQLREKAPRWHQLSRHIYPGRTLGVKVIQDPLLCCYQTEISM